MAALKKTKKRLCMRPQLLTQKDKGCHLHQKGSKHPLPAALGMGLPDFSEMQALKKTPAWEVDETSAMTAPRSKVATDLASYRRT